MIIIDLLSAPFLSLFSQSAQSVWQPVPSLLAFPASSLYLSAPLFIYSFISLTFFVSAGQITFRSATIP